MRCKSCGAHLKREDSICPKCGEIQKLRMDDALSDGAAMDETGKSGKKTRMKAILIAVALCVGLAVGTAVGIGVYHMVSREEPSPTVPSEVTGRSSYTVDDATARAKADEVVATLDGRELNNGLLQVYYWMQFYDFVDNYGSSNYSTDLETSMKSDLGLDLSKPLDEQCLPDSTTTWQQYFLKVALETWRRYQSLCISAESSGFQLDESYGKYLEALPEELQKIAENGGYADVEEMLQKEMGAGCRVEDYAQYLRNYYYGFQYFNDHYETLNPTDEEVRVYFNEHDEEFEKMGVRMDGSKLVDVRHILICPEGGTKDASGNTVFSDEAWAACQTKAQAVLDEWLAGEKTQESFAALAQEKTEDTGSKETGGLYENVYQGYMVENFDKWCFDESRQPGDYGMVQTPFGYHVMYFVGDNPKWLVYGKNSLKTELSNQFVEENMEQYDMEVFYQNIALAAVDFNTDKE